MNHLDQTEIDRLKRDLETDIRIRDRLRDELNWLRSQIVTAPAPRAKESPFAYKVVGLRIKEPA